MKKLIYIATAFAALQFAACTPDGNNDNSADTTPADTIDNTIDSTAMQEVRGIIVDGARRNIDLQVGEDTMNFELESSSDVEWEIGDSLTVRYYMTREHGDSVVEIAH